MILRDCFMFYVIALILTKKKIMTKTLPLYSRDDVAAHKTQDDCWITINNKVYNVTHWLKKHPGGYSILFNLAGQDCSDEYRIFHLEPNEKLLKAFLVGELNPDEHLKDTPISKDLKELQEKLHKEGLFEPDCKFTQQNSWLRCGIHLIVQEYVPNIYYRLSSRLNVMH